MPAGKLRRWAEEVDVRGLIMKNTAFKWAPLFRLDSPCPLIPRRWKPSWSIDDTEARLVCIDGIIDETSTLGFCALHEWR